MTITSSGPKCDVCGKHILPLGDESVNFFRVSAIDKELHSDNACKVIMEKLPVGSTWKALPEGPLKQAFAKANGVESHA